MPPLAEGVTRDPPCALFCMPLRISSRPICASRSVVLSDFRLGLGAIEHRNILNRLGSLRHGDVFGGVAYGFLIFVQPVHGFVCARALVMPAGDFAART